MNVLHQGAALFFTREELAVLFASLLLDHS